jgi:hypothetical protein
VCVLVGYLGPLEQDRGSLEQEPLCEQSYGRPAVLCMSARLNRICSSRYHAFISNIQPALGVPMIAALYVASTYSASLGWFVHTLMITGSIFS